MKIVFMVSGVTVFQGTMYSWLYFNNSDTFCICKIKLFTQGLCHTAAHNKTVTFGDSCLCLVAGRSRSLLHTTDMTDVSFDKIVSSAKELLGDDVSIDAVDLMKVADKYQESDVGKAFSPSMDVITKQLVDIVNETETVIKREERKMAVATRGRKVKIRPTDDIYEAVTPVKEKVKVVVKVGDVRKKDDL